jgi:Flp pilus assembly protein TadD
MGAPIEEEIMSRSIAVTEHWKDLASRVVAGLLLFTIFILAGCDIPTGRRAATDGAGAATAVAAARVEAPATAVPVPEPEPEPVVARVATFEEADLAFRARRYDEATQLFGSYVESKPENPWGYYMLGLSAWKSGDHARAEEAFERSLALDPTHVKSYLNLARVLLETDRANDALARVDSALGFDSLSNVAYRLRGRAFAELGQIDDAVDAYRHAITLDEHDAWSMNNLGVLYIELGWPDEALYPLARAVSLDTTQVIFFNNLGMALEHTGRWSQAAETYRHAVGLDSAYAKATANLARVDGRPDDQWLEPIDLAMIAEEFSGWIGTWRTDVTVVSSETRTP